MSPLGLRGHFVFAPALISEAAVGGFEEAVKFSGGSGECGVDVGGFGRDDEGAMTFGTGFQETAFVPWSGLFVGLPGEVDLDAGEVGVESAKDVEDIGSDGIGKLVMH